MRKWFYVRAAFIGFLSVLGFWESGRAAELINEAWGISLDVGIGGSTSPEFSPPPGRTLILDFVSGNAYCPEGQNITIYATVLNPNRTLDIAHTFIVTSLGRFIDLGGAPRTRFAVSQAVKIYVSSGEVIYFSAVRSASENTCPVNVGFSGHYIQN